VKKVLLVFILFTVVLIFPPKSLAQVVINEVSPASDPEWVEIYNASSDSASLKNYSMNFGSDSQNKLFCDGEVINPNSYKIISLVSHWLADSGDVVTLKNGDDSVDTIGYGSGHTLGKPNASGSVSRSPDGGSAWVLLTTSTQQGDQVSFDCPTPSPSPTPTPTPSPSPTPAPTATPTQTPLSTPTKTPTPKPTPTSTPSPIDSLQPEVLGESTTDFTSTPSPTSILVSKNQETSKPPILAFVLLGGGVLSITASVFLAAKMRYTYLHEEKDSSQT